MAQDNTPNFIRPGMTQDADPANQPHNQAEPREPAFAEDDPATQAPATAEDRLRKGNPLHDELTGHEPVDPQTKERLQPGQT